jgi:Holliday junction resolvase RusA-like endonuclease
MLIKSKEARTYVKEFQAAVPEAYRDLNYGTLDEDLRLDIIIWYTSRRPDLSIELVKDCLEEAGIIKNDRYVREEHIYGFVDKENPRVTLRLYRIPPGRVPPF